jgi:hypothetical protein
MIAKQPRVAGLFGLKNDDSLECSYATGISNGSIAGVGSSSGNAVSL